MIKTILLLTILVSSNIVSATAISSKNSTNPTNLCGLLLEKSHLYKAEALRAEVKEASEKYAKAHPKDAWSMLRGDESVALATPISGHMIYLASGGDIYRPLFDFPLIQHYHLVDGMARWGSSPQYFISEITRRLQELSSSSQVAIIKKGFLDIISVDELSVPYDVDNRHIFEEVILSRPQADEPLVLSVEWESSAAGKIKKYFYIHPMDIHNLPKIKNLLTNIPAEESLVGILEAGYANLPSLEVFHALMHRLSNEGHFIFEHMETINFDPHQMVNAVQGVIGQQYNIQLVLPDEETQRKMAAADRLQQNRISFEVLMSKNP